MGNKESTLPGLTDDGIVFFGLTSARRRNLVTVLVDYAKVQTTASILA